MEKIENLENFNNLMITEKNWIKLSKALGLKPNEIQLFRTLIILCEGEIEFEASNADIAEFMYGDKKTANIRNQVKKLKEWQEKNNYTLFEITPGNKIVTESGRIDYIKTKYKFVVLEDFVTAIYANQTDFDNIFADLLGKIATEFKPLAKSKSYSGFKKLNHTVKSIVTLFKKLVELAEDCEQDPIKECHQVLNKCQIFLSQVESETKKRQIEEDFVERYKSYFKGNSLTEATSLR